MEKNLLVLLFVIVPLFGYAQNWDGVSASYDWYNYPVNGEYVLSTPEDLKGFACLVNGTSDYGQNSFEGNTVSLGCDIFLNFKEWEPIGNIMSGYSFNGTFDGNSHRIFGLNLCKESAGMIVSIGLFGYNKGTIKDLYLNGSTTGVTRDPNNSSYRYGNLVGYNLGRVQSCEVRCDFGFDNLGADGSFGSNGPIIGGIVGENLGTISQCRFVGYIGNEIGISQNMSNIGGISGANYQGGTISECHSTPTIVISGGSNQIGGIAGQNNDDTGIYDCLFDGNINATNTSSTFASGICAMGGLVRNCISIGSIAGDANTYMAPICNSASGVNNCYYVSSLTNTTGAGTNLTYAELSDGLSVKFESSAWTIQNGEIPHLNYANVPTPTFRLTIKDDRGITTTHVAEGIYALDFNSSHSEDGWKINSIVLNGESFLVDDYTYSNTVYVDKDTEIQIVYELVGTEIVDPVYGKYKISGRDGIITIESNGSNETAEIFTLSGRRICKLILSSLHVNFKVGQGTYIVRIGDYSAKLTL